MKSSEQLLSLRTKYHNCSKNCVKENCNFAPFGPFFRHAILENCNFLFVVDWENQAQTEDVAVGALKRNQNDEGDDMVASILSRAPWYYADAYFCKKKQSSKNVIFG